MNNNALFFNLYNVLDDSLRKYYNITNYNTSAISKRINELKNSPLVSYQQRAKNLDIIRNLRNSLAHIEKFTNEDNFTVSIKIINYLKEEIDYLINPITAIDICKKTHELIIGDLNSNILKLCNKMIENGYTHIPILDNNIVIGVFSENTIFSNFSQDGELVISKDALMSKLNAQIQLNYHDTQCFKFVSKNTKIEQLVPLFTNKINNKKLAMLFVTNSGKEYEKLLCIITLHDLINYRKKEPSSLENSS